MNERTPLSADERVEAREQAEKIEPVSKEDSEYESLALEAQNLKVHIPRDIVPQGQEFFYKLAYLQVREATKESKPPARVRKYMIKKLMNNMVKEMTDFMVEENEKKKQENQNVSRRF